MTDDLVKRLDAEINATYGKHPCGLLNEAKTRIEQLEAALERHASFIVRNDMWEVFVASLKEKENG